MTSRHHRSDTAQMLMTLASFVIVVAGMYAAKVILVPFLLSAFIAVISSPPLFWLQQKGLPKWLALLVVILTVLLVGFLVVNLVTSSVRDFSGNLSTYETKLKRQSAALTAWFDRLGMDTSGLSSSKLLDASAAMKLTAAFLNGIVNALARGVLILMTVIFILLEAAGLPAKLKKIIGEDQAAFDRFGVFIDTVKRYMAIKTIISLVTGALATILLLFVGVDYALLWGLIAFALNYVPNIGSIIAAIPAVLLALIQIDIISALIVAGGYLFINILMGSGIEPRFMGRELGLSTLIVFLSLMFWGWVLGPVGMLLSVPLTMTVKIALDSREETRWLSILLGPDHRAAKKPLPQE